MIALAETTPDFRSPPTIASPMRPPPTTVIVPSNLNPSLMCTSSGLLLLAEQAGVAQAATIRVGDVDVVRSEHEHLVRHLLKAAIQPVGEP